MPNSDIDNNTNHIAPIDSSTHVTIDDISRIEKAMFLKLDALGIAALRILYKYPAPELSNDDITISQETYRVITPPKPNRLIDFNNITLSDIQQGLLTQVMEKMRADRVSNETQREKYTSEELLQYAWAQLNNKNIASICNKYMQDTILVYTPLGFTILLTSEDAAKRWGTDKAKDMYNGSSYKLEGLYVRRGIQNILPPELSGRFIYVNTCGRDIDEINTTILHEYLHMLYKHYIQTAYEGLLPTDREQYDLCEYKTSAVRQLFETMRDELVAYAFANSAIPINPDPLLPIGQTYKSAINDIETNNRNIPTGLQDINKLNADVIVFYSVLLKYSNNSIHNNQNNIPIKELAQIFLTSTNFIQIAKRLILLKATREQNK
jgi:hypothetical protein